MARVTFLSTLGLALSLIFVGVASAQNPPENVSVDLTVLRGTPFGNIDGGVVFRHFHELERQAVEIHDRQQRQEAHLFLGKIARIISKNVHWELRNLRKASVDGGSVESKKECLLRLAEIYGKGVDHNLPIKTDRAYVPVAMELVDSMLTKTEFEPWRAEILLSKGRLLSRSAQPDDALRELEAAVGLSLPNTLVRCAAMSELCQTLSSKGDVDGALQRLETALGTTNPDGNLGGWIALQHRKITILKSAKRMAELEEAVSAYIAEFDRIGAADYEDSMRFLRSLEYTSRRSEVRARLRILIQNNPDESSYRSDMKFLCMLSCGKRGSAIAPQELDEALAMHMTRYPEDNWFATSWRMRGAKIAKLNGLQTRSQELQDRVIEDSMEGSESDYRAQIEAAIYLKVFLSNPKAKDLFQKGLRNAFQALGRAQADQEKADILRLIARGGLYLNNADAIAYAVSEATGGLSSPDVQGDLLDVRFLEACSYLRTREYERVRSMLEKLLADFPDEIGIVKVQKQLGIVEDKIAAR